MKPIKKLLASDFPMIPLSDLHLIIETCNLPRKAQNLPEIARKARILAMRLRTVQAIHKHKGGDVTMPGSVWENIIEFLTAHIKTGDFSTIDHFCEGWTQTRAKAQKVEIKSVELNGKSQPDMLIIHSRLENEPGIKIPVTIASAIIALQRKLNRPPFPQEIVDHCNDPKRGPKAVNVSNADVSEFLKRWKLKGALPDKRKNPL